MTRHLILTALISILLLKCQTHDRTTEDTSSKKADSLQKAFNEELRHDSIDCNLAVNNPTQIKGLFKAECPNDTLKGIPVSSNKRSPFDTIATRTKDTLYYSFKVSNTCCMKYFGQYFVESETLVFSYGLCKNYFGCDCDCDYLLKYKVPLKQYNFRNIVIRTVDPKRKTDNRK
jgi:hypothetical protein